MECDRDQRNVSSEIASLPVCQALANFSRIARQKETQQLMKSISGIVTRSLATIRISDITASETYDCEFSICHIEVFFSSSRFTDIAVGDMVIAAGNLKNERMTAFAIHDLSTGTRRNSGVVSSLFVALFALIFGLFGVVVTSVFLAPFASVILALTAISFFYLLYRSFSSLASYILVWYHRRQMSTDGELAG